MEPSFEDRKAKAAIRAALEALRDVMPDSPDCAEHLNNAERELRAALQAVQYPVPTDR